MRDYTVRIPLKDGSDEHVDFSADNERAAKTKATKIIQEYYKDDNFVASSKDMKRTKWYEVDSKRWLNENTNGNRAWKREIPGTTITKYAWHLDQDAVLHEI